jgi:hypothetical protein
MGASYLIIQGAPGDDITEHLRTLMGQAVTEGKSIWLSYKNAVISSTVELKANIHGPGVSTASFVTVVSDGSPTLERGKAEGVSLHGFAIEGENGKQNTVALKLGDTGVTPPETKNVSRSTLRDIKIWKCAVGLEWQGWINDVSNVLITWCDVGAKLKYQNASRLDIKYEANDKDFELSISAGVFIPVLLMEGSKDTHKDASTISNVNALTIGSLYTELGQEGVEESPWLHIGFPNTCKNVVITSAILGFNDVESVLIHKVDGFLMRVASYGIVPVYRITEEATNVDIKEFVVREE